MFVCDNSTVQNSSKCWRSVVCVPDFPDLNVSSLDSIYDLTTCLAAAVSLCYLMRPPTDGIHISLCVPYLHIFIVSLGPLPVALVRRLRRYCKKSERLLYSRCSLEQIFHPVVTVIV